MKVTGAYHGLSTRQDDKGRAFHTLSVEGLRVEIPAAIADGVLPRLRDLPVGADITLVVAPTWRGGERRWLSWVLLSIENGRG